MADSRGDPHEIEGTLEAAEEYVAPPREQEQEVEDGPATSEDGQPIDVNLLHAQGRKPGLRTSEPIATDPSEAPITISGRDEESDEPGAVPPGEAM